MHPLEDIWVCIDLGDRLTAVVDLEDSPRWLYVSLHWPHIDLDPPGTRPYGWEASVRFTGAVEQPFMIENVPAADHQKACEFCDLERETLAFDSTIKPCQIEALLDVLSGLPRQDRYWWLDALGTPLWRGRVDAHGRAIVDLVPSDDSKWSVAPFAVIARVPLGLRST